MIDVIPTITDAGLQAAFNADNDGIDLKITAVGLTNESFTPTQDMTSLQGEIERFPVKNGLRATDTQVNLTVIVDGNNEYWIKGVGFYLEDGTLFAIWSNPNPFANITYGPADVAANTLVIETFNDEAQAGNYTLTCTDATENSEVFDIVAPDNSNLGSLTASEIFSSTHFDLDLNTGFSWTIGDEIQIKVSLEQNLGFKSAINKFDIQLNLVLAAVPANSITVEQNGDLGFHPLTVELIRLATSHIVKNLRELRMSERLRLLEKA
ncbi:phage tail protein [Candidatus Albibeggiatoa sp. nov. NOAA]|uniref:phage tail protein n=1 Tax=Candidatus Albibeggiatoa sp. nov. NOAA TaxID=3162724 RepID=UPI0032FBBA57|nr:phage tail protein [Thiotrichaceae bacterium]